MLEKKLRDFTFPKSTIIIFSKAPEPGITKTRLIPELGSIKAAELHKAMTNHVVAMVADARLCSIQLWCAPQISHPFFESLVQHYSLTLHQQIGKDLGMRMYNAFDYSFNQALKSYNAAVVIGSDCLTIDAHLIESSLQKLYEGQDAVIAPAEDGGYVLLGLKRAQAEIFTDINWGNDTVFSQTVNRFKQLGLSWTQMDTQWDIDRPQDIKRLKQHQAQLNLHSELRTLIKDL